MSTFISLFIVTIKKRKLQVIEEEEDEAEEEHEHETNTKRMRNMERKRDKPAKKIITLMMKRRVFMDDSNHEDDHINDYWDN